MKFHPAATAALTIAMIGAAPAVAAEKGDTTWVTTQDSTAPTLGVSIPVSETATPVAIASTATPTTVSATPASTPGSGRTRSLPATQTPTPTASPLGTRVADETVGYEHEGDCARVTCDTTQEQDEVQVAVARQHRVHSPAVPVFAAGVGDRTIGLFGAVSLVGLMAGALVLVWRFNK